VIRKRLGRLATVITAGAMALLLLGVGGAVAKTPSGWSISVTKLPATVKAGNNAGYDVTIRNVGPSNVNAVTFTIVPKDTPNATPAYFSGLTPFYTCTTSGQVVCDIGTMAAGTVITLRVAYAVPTTSSGTFDVSFELKAGSGYVPGNNQSRGDAYANLVKTSLSSSANFDGGFTVDSDGTFQTTGNLGRNNKQVTSLDTSDLYIPVTVTDGVADYPCNLCTNLVGEWSILDVNNGNSGPIKVTLLIWGGSVPGGVSADELYLVHANGDGTFNNVTETCDLTHTNADCLESVTKVGNNFRVVAWLAKNGGHRGGF